MLLSTGILPSQAGYESSVQAKAVEQRYMALVESVRKVDFGNLYYYIGKGTTGDIVQLRNGKSEISFRFGLDSFSLDRVYYFRPTRSAHEVAVVEIRHFYEGRSSSQDGVLLVFQIDDESLVITQQLVYDQQLKGTGTEFDPGTRTLIIHASARCCPKSIDEVTFEWNGKAFEEKSHRISVGRNRNKKM